jgi:hypothetical protein
MYLLPIGETDSMTGIGIAGICSSCCVITGVYSTASCTRSKWNILAVSYVGVGTLVIGSEHFGTSIASGLSNVSPTR